jgi:thioredoxin reductase
MNRKEFLKSTGLLAGGLSTLPFSAVANEKEDYRVVFGNRAQYDAQYDVVIVGGSYSGLSAALTLARCLRKVLVVDAGLPRNQKASEAYNAFSMDGQKPEDINDTARKQLKKYVDFLHLMDGSVSAVSRNDGTFTITVASDKEIRSAFVVFATGAEDGLPDIKGLKEQWGKNVHHCPYCHGFESRNGRTMLITKDFKGLELLASVNHWSQELFVAMQTKMPVPDQMASLFETLNISWNTTTITEVVSDNKGALELVVFEDGSREEVQNIYLSTEVSYRTEFLKDLKCDLDDQGRVITDDFMLSSQPNIYAVGDISSKSMGQIIWAANSGMMAGVHINNTMIANTLKS